MKMKKQVKWMQIEQPEIYDNVPPVYLTDETINKRKEKLLQLMKKEEYDALVIYADKEHGSNFEYLTGFIPRFEEAVFVIKSNGDCSYILGNENLKMAKHARTTGTVYHCPLFSLNNQPMNNDHPLEMILDQINFSTSKKIGLVGWKMFTSKVQDNDTLFDIPHFIVEAVRKAKHEYAKIVNAAYLFIRGDIGIRTTNNANEIAHYEYGANLASSCMLKALNAVDIDVKESFLGSILNGDGQTNNVVTIAATGKRFEFANLYPTNKQTKVGDPISLTTGYKGGLTSRTGFIVENKEQLPSSQKDYLDKVAIPYYQTFVYWLENIKIGMSGGNFYDLIEVIFPKEKYNWQLNPGHLVSDEEWMSSPIYPDSTEELKSGMILQIDIIPSIEGYAGVSAEDTIALANEELRNKLKNEYPQVWNRIQKRRNYIQEQLNIHLSEEVLPLSNTVGYYRPYLLTKDQALTCK
ncbi:Xaa-Pro peptidase family protein [Neobacillus niacini]|uniref:M24 family metallopeptidase n=1 Tax=Neobacillus niacini TaxID=86668 RepID=UPI0021CB0A42|nr:aminopeptidase P family protein [Neobacillus niacini]MCM3768121.1 aminopeptidase P family N-terminal domain-containing protein [Neobacillus niacini]